MQFFPIYLFLPASALPTAPVHNGLEGGLVDVIPEPHVWHPENPSEKRKQPQAFVAEEKRQKRWYEAVRKCYGQKGRRLQCC